jgi:hypothetical protein
MLVAVRGSGRVEVVSRQGRLTESIAVGAEAVRHRRGETAVAI